MAKNVAYSLLISYIYKFNNNNNKVYCTEKMWSFFESRKFNIYYIPGLAWDPLLILQVGLKRLCRNCSGCLSRHLTQILYYG